MGILTTWNSLTAVQVASVPKQQGVFELANFSRSTIYIGRSDDLHRRLQGAVNATDPCRRRATYFRYELTPWSEQRERELLEEYFHQHDRYPPCN